MEETKALNGIKAAVITIETFNDLNLEDARRRHDVVAAMLTEIKDAIDQLERGIKEEDTNG